MIILSGMLFVVCHLFFCGNQTKISMSASAPDGAVETAVERAL
jgi:hypothetical protein